MPAQGAGGIGGSGGAGNIGAPRPHENVGSQVSHSPAVNRDSVLGKLSPRRSTQPYNVDEDMAASRSFQFDMIETSVKTSKGSADRFQLAYTMPPSAQDKLSLGATEERDAGDSSSSCFSRTSSETNRKEELFLAAAAEGEVNDPPPNGSYSVSAHKEEFREFHNFIGGQFNKGNVGQFPVAQPLSSSKARLEQSGENKDPFQADYLMPSFEQNKLSLATASNPSAPPPSVNSSKAKGQPSSSPLRAGFFGRILSAIKITLK